MRWHQRPCRRRRCSCDCSLRIWAKQVACYAQGITMFMFRASWQGAIAAVATAWLSQAAIADSDSLNEQFVQTQKIIEANCAECYGASQEDFIHAVGALESLIAAGFTAPAAAKLLAQSYRTWALVYSKGNSKQSEGLLRNEQDIYATLVKQNPNDARLWIAYAQSLGDQKKSLEALKRAESLAPDNAEIQYHLGALYAQGLNEPKKGLAYLERAVQLEEGYAKLRYGQQLAFVLELMGEKARAQKVRSDMKAFERELEERDRLKQSKT